MSKLDELKALMTKATPGQWFSQEKYLGVPRGGLNYMVNVCFDADENAAHANAKLIANAINALPSLIAAVEALKKIAYEPFGPTDATHAEVLQEITDTARAALAKLGE